MKKGSKKDNKKKNDEFEDEEDDDDADNFAERSVDFNFKIILVGSAEVGKTSIKNRYVTDSFDENEMHSREVQIHYKVLEIPNSSPSKIAQLHIWDTLG